MSSVAAELRGSRAPAGLFPSTFPLYAVFLSLPVWWVLGAGEFIWPVLTFPLLLSLALRPDVRVPPRFGIWLFFLAFLLLSSLQVDSGLHAALFVYRASLYISATILFLYVLNASPERLPDGTIVRVLALFWVEVIIGGFLGVLFPRVSFSTPVEAVVPASFLRDQTAHFFVHPAFSDVQTILGYAVGRPKVLFPYTNQWGACVAVLLPFALAALVRLPPGLARRSLATLLVASIVPIVISLNRGLWLSAGVGLAYVTVRLARRQNTKAISAGFVAVLAGATLIVVTPLGSLVHDRFTAERNSDNTRLSIYTQTIEQVKSSPVIGFGLPRVSDSTGNQSRSRPAIGSQGQLFTLLFSYGIPATLLFLGWFGYTFVRSRTGSSYGRFWSNAAILILIVEMPYYDFMPVTLHVAMVAAGLAWRDILDGGAAGRGSKAVAAPRRTEAG